MFIDFFVIYFQLIVQFQKMNNNLICLNQNLYDAYQYLQQNKIQQCVHQYQKSLKYASNPQFRDNIKCTIAILNHVVNKENKLQYLQEIIDSNQSQQSRSVLIRALVNLILINILEGELNNAIDLFQKLMEVLQRVQNVYKKKQMLQFTTYLFFRVVNLSEIGQHIQNLDIKGMRLEQINMMSLMAFNSQICKLQTQQRVQRKCYQQFIKHERYDLALFSLRCLIKYTKSSVNKKVYQKQLGQIIMLGFFEQDANFNNYEIYDVAQAIMEQFIKFRNTINQQIRLKELKNVLVKNKTNVQPEFSNDQVLIQWKYTLKLMYKDVVKTKEMNMDNKKFILNMLRCIQSQNNILVIRQMKNNLYFSKYYQKVKQSFKVLQNLSKNTSKSLLKQSFLLIKGNQLLPLTDVKINRDRSPRSKLNMRSQKKMVNDKSPVNYSKRKQDSFIEKQNNPQLGISLVSLASCSKISMNQTRRRIFQDHGVIYTAKKVQKMIKTLQYGNFLNKRNFNSEGGQYKFVKIDSTYIKWAKDPQKIQNNSQKYGLKDIRSITYGRVSQNLNQNSNKILSYSKCFSLLLQKRTLDFYCKNYEVLEAWVCGLSSILKKNRCKVVGYTPGKLRWKKIFAILRQNFIEPLRANQRKYYYENSYSLILFAKNGYKLPRNNQK